ncbi:MAG TPA: hypothetical protein VN841_14695 [Bryobacteraceae bacterium]|nr:hypothetical protein [Bryobacteraceae bacterium]
MNRRNASRLAACVAGITCVCAQSTVAPSNEPTQDPNGDNVSNYSIRQSFEAGYRWDTTGGDFGMYQSTVNYTNGLRLLASSLDVQSRDGHGGLFDQIVLNTQGLGNDPYQFASLHIEKNRLYRYDLTWRSIAYVNPAATVSFGEHAMDTTRHLQDQDLTLFPQSSVRFFLGYSRNTQSGPALTTQQLFDANGNEFPLFANIRREQNEYRLGGEVRFAGFRLNILHAWQDFKEDTPTDGTPLPQGNNPNSLTTLTSFQRSAPYHGTSPYWRGALFREGRFGQKRFWTMNALATYVAGQRGFVQDEFASGTNRIGALTQLQVATFGNAQRPAFTGNLTFSLFPATWITLTNQSSVYNIRMVGDSYYTQFTNGSQGAQILPFTYLGIRTVANSTDAEMRLRPWFSVHAGYDYSTRLISSVEGGSEVGVPFSALTAQQTNQLHTGVLGFRLKPIASLTIRLDGELGRADHPIYPVSEGNFQAFRGRIEYKHRSLRLSAYGRSDYNINSVSLSSFASHARQYGADASWAGNKWFSIDASYAKQHLYTLGGIDYFANRAEVTGESSLYISNIHTATLAARFNFKDKADLSVGYSHVQDVGDGRATPIGPGTLTVSFPTFQYQGPYTSQPAFAAAQTFPLKFLSPMARISIRVSNRVRWNAGYQYYGYAEDFSALQNYRAHTGYSSLAWSF